VSGAAWVHLKALLFEPLPGVLHGSVIRHYGEEVVAEPFLGWSDGACRDRRKGLESILESVVHLVELVTAVVVENLDLLEEIVVPGHLDQVLFWGVKAVLVERLHSVQRLLNKLWW
jgi:hypothetical protein